jgi:hypothetical protein
VDEVRDARLSWHDVCDVLPRSVRWTPAMDALDDAACETLFRDHVRRLAGRSEAAFQQLIDGTHAITLATSWSAAASLLAGDPRFAAFGRDDECGVTLLDACVRLLTIVMSAASVRQSLPHTSGSATAARCASSATFFARPGSVFSSGGTPVSKFFCPTVASATARMDFLRGPRPRRQPTISPSALCYQLTAAHPLPPSALPTITRTTLTTPRFSARCRYHAELINLSPSPVC